MPDTTSHKICSVCKDWKPRTCFYKESRVQDGLQSQCNDCKAEYRKRYRQTEHGRRLTAKLARDQYQREDRDVLRCRNAIRKAVYRKKLKHPESCSRCGKVGKVQAHHYLGYNYENRYDVMWLCPMCHVCLDKKRRENEQLVDTA